MDPSLHVALPRALSILAELKSPEQSPDPPAGATDVPNGTVAAPARPPLADTTAMNVWETVYIVHTHRQLLQDALTRDALEGPAGNHRVPPTPAPSPTTNPSELTLEHRTALIASLQNLEQSLLDAMNDRISEMPLKPRVFRLADRLKLTPKELRAWVCILLHCSGVAGPSESTHALLLSLITMKGRSELLTIREFAGFDSIAELLHFLSPSNPIMKQGLLEVDDEYSTSYSESKFRAPREVIKALFGGHITLDEYMTVDGTALAKVLAEEPGSVVNANGVNASTKVDEGDIDVDREACDGPSDDDKSTASGVETEDAIVRHRDANATNDTGDHSTSVDIDPLHRRDDMLGLLSELHMNAGENEAKRSAGKKTFAGSAATAANGSSVSNDHASVASDDDEGADGEDLGPFKSDMDYLEDGFKVVQEACKVYNFKEKGSEEDRFQSTKRPVEALQREAEAKQRKAFHRFSRRLQKTRSTNTPLPRLELLVDKLKLDHFERMVIMTLVAGTLSQPVRKALRADPSSRCDLNVAKLLRLHCNGDLKEEVRSRFHFYRRGRLIRSGIVTVDAPLYGLLGDLGECIVDLDHMVLDFVAGLQTEIDELMDSARCYTPKVAMDSVILPKEMKDLVLRQAENFELFRKMRKAVGLDDIVRYGGGLTLLFHGRSGTGKTMFANALATHLKRKLLVVDFAALNNSKFSGSEAYRIVFREATIHRAIVFFDECDEILESRDQNGREAVAIALREMEVFDGILILATNRAHMLDEAVHRRISLSLEFAAPDVEHRLDIWKKHIPSGLRIADDVDFGALALEYELSGGLIKNAILQALSSAVSRLREEHSIPQEKVDQGRDFQSATGLAVESVVISMQDLRAACRLQARGHLKRARLERRIIPNAGLDTLVVPETAMAKLQEVVMVEKVRGLLSTRWGFKSRVGRSNCVLLFGPRGCGKSYAAACVGFETGRPLQTISMSEIASMRDCGEQISDVFSEASIAGAVVVIEQGEQLLLDAADLGTTDSTGVELLYHMQTYNGLVIVCCTSVRNPTEAGWDVFQPVPNRVTCLLSFMIVLEQPGREARLQLWKQLIPVTTPLASEVRDKLEEVATKYEFTGARINACIRRAAATAAMRANRISLTESLNAKNGAQPTSASSQVTIDDITQSCETEVKMAKEAGGLESFAGLYV